MNKFFSKSIAISALFFAQNLFAQNQNPQCSYFVNGVQKRVHVWYTLNNKDMNYNWFVQISRNFEDNITFVDETCSKLEITEKINLPANTSKKVGMIVEVSKSFSSIYSFTGVRNDQALSSVPNRKMMCMFLVAPYGPGQMDRMDWKLNNADCHAAEYGTQLYFK